MVPQRASRSEHQVMAKTNKKTRTADMVTAKFSLNKPARDLFGDATSARVRIRKGEFLVRPTNRTKGLGNLPKTDDMVELSRTLTGTKFTVPMDAEAGATFIVEPLKYGWLSLTAATDNPGRDTPVARVVVR